MEDDTAVTADAPTLGTDEKVIGNAIQNASAGLTGSSWATPTGTDETFNADPAKESDAVKGTQPRDESGRFASPAPTDGSAPAEAAAEGTEPDAPVEGEEAAEETPEAVAEPKTLVLKGDGQRGEDDIELDVSGLPDDVVQRIERNENMGMRKRDYDAKVAEVDNQASEFRAVETEIALNPTGFVLDRLAPATKLGVARALVAEMWDELLPELSAWDSDPASRSLALANMKDTSRNMRDQVTQRTTLERQAQAVLGAVRQTIPSGADTADASEYFEAARAILRNRALDGEQVTPDKVPSLLSKLSARYGFVPSDESKDAPKPARPKLAVINRAQASGVAGAVPNKAAQIANRNAAKKVAPQGAGAAPVQVPGPPKNANIAQASAFLRKSSGGWTQPT